MLNIKKGRLLISDPSLIEETFFKSVILITHHTEDESIGLILNQETRITLDQLLKDIPVSDFPVYIGGPVEKNSIQFIHTLGNIIPNTQEINKGLYWGGDFEKLLTLISKNKISKNQVRFFVGYSGWGANQLNHEIKETGWITHEANTNLCMQYSNKKLWRDLIKNKPQEYAIWVNMPKDPSLN